MATWEEQHEAIDAMLAWLPSTFSRFSRRNPDAMLAQAAALARCCRLVVGLDTLVHNRMQDDLAGVFVRPLFETWLTGCYLHYEQDEGWESLKSDTRRQFDVLNERADLSMDFGPSWAPGAQKPPVDQMALAVGRAMEAAGEPVPEYPLEAYNLVYRSTSVFDVHGGAGPLVGHMDRARSGVFRLNSVRVPGTSAETRLLWCGALLAALAEKTFERFEFPRIKSEFLNIASPLSDARDPSSWNFTGGATGASTPNSDA